MCINENQWNFEIQIKFFLKDLNKRREKNTYISIEFVTVKYGNV